MPAVHEIRLPSASRRHSWRRWGASLARSLYAGVFVGMISGFLTLLISIVTLIIGKLLFNRVLIDPPVIYREIAPAVAVIVAVLTFIGNLVWERTHPAPAPDPRT
jgi:uncharacterized membrane protein YbhN (UPF0104 family)